MGLRAMTSAISGLQSHSVWLDVIGNNLSNVNTLAYKSSRLEFSEQISQTLFGGSGDNSSNNTGGVNPQQIGLGTRVASIQTLFAQGPTLTTGKATDIAIEGDGFLTVKQGGRTFLSRAGNLSFDGAGYLVNQNGERVQGYNANLQYQQKLINTFSNIPGQPLNITAATMALDTSNISNITNIRLDTRMVIPPKATTVVHFRGNLDSFQQPNLLDLFPGGPGIGLPTLPVGLMLALIPPPLGIDTARMTTQATAGGGFTLKQAANLANPLPGTNIPVPLDNGIIPIGAVRFFRGNYAWEQVPPIRPAQQTTETVYDSTGNKRQITVQFYQINDLGSANPPINPPPGPNQVCYAWYAFETTGAVPVSTRNLIGGTGIWEGDVGGVAGYDRGIPTAMYAGDFLWFNTDGSLASSGGIAGPPAPPGVPNFMDVPRVYLPPVNRFPPISPLPTKGSEIMAVELDFGTWGILGQGRRDGLTGDAEGKYQPVNGVNTYVPNHTVYPASQDGYADGTLQGVNFNASGILQGSFSNGQIIDLAQVALTQVDNPEGLNKIGNNDYVISPNAGPTHLGLPGTGNFGTIQGGALEGSNVDLTVELSNMIIAQRGFQANARVISVVNSTLDVLNHLGQ